MASNRPTTDEQVTAADQPITNSVGTIGTTQQPDAPDHSDIKASGGVKRPGDRIFEFLSTASATLITVLIAALPAVWEGVAGGLAGVFFQAEDGIRDQIW